MTASPSPTLCDTVPFFVYTSGS